MIYEYNKETVEELVQRLTADDIVQLHAEDFLQLVGKSGRPKGRKPIAFDEECFLEVVSRWQSGMITARAAMQELNLKPNTFYRRVKEYTEMTDIKEIKKAIKEETKDFKAALKAEEKELKANLRAEKEDMKELKSQVKSEAKELKKQLKSDAREFKKQLDSDARDLKKQFKESADEFENTLSLKQMEREIRHEKYEAEAEHDKEVIELEKEVAAEAEAYKNQQ